MDDSEIAVVFSSLNIGVEIEQQQKKKKKWCMKESIRFMRN